MIKTWREKRLYKIIRKLILWMLIIIVTSTIWIITLYNKKEFIEYENFLLKLDKKVKYEDVRKMSHIIDSLTSIEYPTDTIYINNIKPKLELLKIDSIKIDSIKIDTNQIKIDSTKINSI